jgi:UDP-N-acetylmuramyl tripeptide synthase
MIRLRDSRRLTGPNLLMDRAGAVIEATREGDDPDRVIALWRDALGRMLAAVGWERETAQARSFPGGLILAVSAPLDALYAATEVNEWAFAATEAALDGAAAPDFGDAAERLRATIAAERRPRFQALQVAAAERGVAFVPDHHHVSIGLGAGSRSWPIDDLPEPEAVDWNAIRDVPVALVTGTNGKSTTVRLLASIAAAAGCTAGFSSTDGVWVGVDRIASGDYSGPGGARTVLRDPRVELAVLETARGGILRRGLAVRRAEAAVVTNVAADHIGEFGIHDLDALAETKLVVGRVVGPSGRVVLNADDERLRWHADRLRAPITWFTLDSPDARVREHVAAGGDAAWLEAGSLTLAQRGATHPVIAVEALPFAFGGAARHNLANALAALGAAAALGLPRPAMAQGLNRFESTPQQNPGRANVWEIGGVRALVDFAHNPHGLASLVTMAAALPARRRLILIGQAGDRSDEDIRELGRVSWGLRADRVIVNELPEYLRGRAAGAVPDLLVAGMREAGAPADRIRQVGSELEGVREALAWARPGDLLVFTIHAQRREAERLLNELRTRAWSAGEPIGV